MSSKDKVTSDGDELINLDSPIKNLKNLPTSSKKMSEPKRVELAPYTPGQPGGIRTWLRQVEIRLKLADITNKISKYEYVVAALPNEITARVYDLIIAQPETSPFTTLVARIKEEFEPTESEGVIKLLKGLKRGDKKPSLFLREMRELAGKQVGDTLLRELFLAELPTSTAEILSVIEIKELESLAKAADKAWERESQTRAVLSVSNDIASSSQPDRIDKLLDKVDKMLDTFNHLSHESSSGGRRRRDATPAHAGKRDSRSHSRSRK